MAAIVKGKEDRRRREARDSKRVQRSNRSQMAEGDRNNHACSLVVLLTHLRDVRVIREEQLLAEMLFEEEWAELVEEDAIEQEWARLGTDLASLETEKRRLLEEARLERLPADLWAFRMSTADFVGRTAHFLEEVQALMERRRKFRERE